MKKHLCILEIVKKKTTYVLRAETYVSFAATTRFMYMNTQFDK